MKDTVVVTARVRRLWPFVLTCWIGRFYVALGMPPEQALRVAETGLRFARVEILSPSGHVISVGRLTE